jgi:FkbM family methyltransferase
MQAEKRPKSDPLEKYASFQESWRLMGDEYSRQLFAELIAIKLLGEDHFRLSSFPPEHPEAYERASETLLASSATLDAYQWVLRSVSLTNPEVQMFTTPEILALHYINKLYCYCQGAVAIQVAPGDTVIDAGVGWGDTTVYLGARSHGHTSGTYHAFDILEEGIRLLECQLALNPRLTRIEPVLLALSDVSGQTVSISDAPSPSASVVAAKTRTSVTTTTIDDFARSRSLSKVDFIKMDIEGAELPALKGASEVIGRYKPKLAISVYHKWDDLLEIPRLVHGLRADYQFYLDCTTGFGGEAVMYCC